jgi:hypothetical protein
MIGYYMNQASKEESVETKRRQRAEILHSLQGPIQQRLGEKKYESSVQEIDTRLQIISQMPGRNVKQS